MESLRTIFKLFSIEKLITKKIIYQNLWGETKAALTVEFITLIILLKIKHWKGVLESFVSETRKETTRHQKKVEGRNWNIRKKRKKEFI